MSNSDYPEQVQLLHAALESIPGVHDVSSTIQSLQGLTSRDLEQVAFADLPHATLRRTRGGLKGEVLVQIEFRITPSPRGWSALEFLAWFIRDQARGGVSVQLRPHALPPVAGRGKQRTSTLRFVIDMFFISRSGDLAPVLVKIAETAACLRLLLRA